MQFRPADIAKECGVSVGTVRAWCGEFSEFLSAGANPSDGDRKLSERDLEVCRYIAQLRTEGMSKPQIALRLRETSFGTVEPTEKPIGTTTEKPIESPTFAVDKALQSAVEPATMPLAMLEHYEALEKRLDERLTTIEANNRSWVQGLAVALSGLRCSSLFWSTW